MPHVRTTTPRTITTTMLAGLSLISTSVVMGEPAAPAPALTYAFSVRIELSPPVEQGTIDGARHRFIPITGGTISGPRLSGTVMAGGGDWQAIHPGGLTTIEARYFLRADDGTIISITNPGVRVASPDVTDRLARGEQVDPASYYFRSTPRFDVAPGPHDWLRTRTFVARGARAPDHVDLDVYTVE